MHPVMDRPLKLLGDAFGPVALVMVGVTLAQAGHRRAAAGRVRISPRSRTLLHPALMARPAGLAGPAAACRWR
jgi:malonate transporter